MAEYSDRLLEALEDLKIEEARQSERIAVLEKSTETLKENINVMNEFDKRLTLFEERLTNVTNLLSDQIETNKEGFKTLNNNITALTKSVSEIEMRRDKEILEKYKTTQQKVFDVILNKVVPVLISALLAGLGLNLLQ